VESVKLYDISMAVHPGMAVYRNKEVKQPLWTIQQDFSTGSVFESVISMNMHTGTHMDAPLHMLEDGGTIDTISLDKTVTPCKVLDFTDSIDRITREDLEKKDICSGDFILLKTRNSMQEAFDPDFIYLELSGAEYLKELSVKGVGIDALGIERSQPGHPTHKTLLGSGIVILEGLRLAAVEEGEYLLVAAPLKIKNAEAAPVRAVLVEMEYNSYHNTFS
jgi:arylformamidase